MPRSTEDGLVTDLSPARRSPPIVSLRLASRPPLWASTDLEWRWEGRGGGREEEKEAANPQSPATHLLDLGLIIMRVRSPSPFLSLDTDERRARREIEQESMRERERDKSLNRLLVLIWPSRPTQRGKRVQTNWRKRCTIVLCDYTMHGQKKSSIWKQYTTSIQKKIL